MGQVLYPDFPPWDNSIEKSLNPKMSLAVDNSVSHVSQLSWEILDILSIYTNWETKNFNLPVQISEEEKKVLFQSLEFLYNPWRLSFWCDIDFSRVESIYDFYSVFSYKFSNNFFQCLSSIASQERNPIYKSHIHNLEKAFKRM